MPPLDGDLSRNLMDHDNTNHDHQNDQEHHTQCNIVQHTAD